MAKSGDTQLHPTITYLESYPIQILPSVEMSMNKVPFLPHKKAMPHRGQAIETSLKTATARQQITTQAEIDTASFWIQNKQQIMDTLFGNEDSGRYGRRTQHDASHSNRDLTD